MRLDRDQHIHIPKRTFFIVLFITVGLGALAFMVSFGYLSTNRPSPQAPQGYLAQQLQGVGDAPAPQQPAAEVATQTLPITATVAKAATPGVVGVSVLRVDSGAIFDRNTAEKWGVGSGVIVSPDGYILTNHHVAGGPSERIVVSFYDGRNLDGITVWSDPVLDLAVVKVNGSGLKPLPLGDANTLQVGETAIAIGNPLGLQFQRTVTSGIISALNRTIKLDEEQGGNYMEDLIQTDASINPGNSGGPLLNSKGEVVGINTVKVASAEGIGFAVPVNIAIPIIRQYTSTGDFKEPYLGVFAYDKEVIPYLHEDVYLDNGVYVVNVDEGGPAYKNGIRLGCIIKQIDGESVSTMLQLRTYLYNKRPGDTVYIKHLMDGKDVTVPVVLGQKPKAGMVTR